MLNVGAESEVEQKAKQHKPEDALNAKKAAVEEGIVPGGGVALLRAAKMLDESQITDEEERLGYKILKRALEAPIRQIAQNAGKDGSVIASDVAKSEEGFGYNAATDTIEDLVAAGVVDPTKVVRIALENAVSASAMLLTTEFVVADLPDDKDKAPAMPDMSGMGAGGF